MGRFVNRQDTTFGCALEAEADRQLLRKWFETGISNRETWTHVPAMATSRGKALACTQICTPKNRCGWWQRYRNIGT